MMIPFLLFVMLAGLLPGGCSAPGVNREAYVAVPPDFGLSVLVLGPDRTAAWEEMTEEQQQKVPASHLSTRFIVEPDGTLRTAVGPGVSEDLYPSRLRELSSAQMLSLWRVVRNQGLITAETTHGRTSAPDNAEISRSGAIDYISIQALGDRVTIAVPVSELSRVGEGARRLVRLLRAYSWMGDIEQ